MLELEYQQEDFFNVAWDAVDRGQSFKVVVKGQRIKTLKKLITTYLRYTSKPENKRLLLPLALYGMRFPLFCAVLIHSTGWKVEMNVDELKKCMIVSFLSEPGATGRQAARGTWHLYDCKT